SSYDPYANLTDTDYPVVGASPWEILGNPAHVIMSNQDPFVGEHSPQITAGAGIKQHDLGVIADQKYVGYIWVKPINGDATINLSLRIPGQADDSREIEIKSSPDFERYAFEFTAAATLERGATFSIEVAQGDVVLGPPSLMPANNIKGMRADTIALLKQLNAPVYRWPGGNFVSGYNWRDGIGDRDRRPPRKNPAWTGVEHNDFGTDEFIAFCREIDTAPMIAVNTGFGDAYTAAQWVEYTNASADTIGGGWRAINGNPAPYDVKNWCIGNEMWGRWQLGFMALSHYTIKHNEVSAAMWAIDPDLVLVGVGDLESKYDENNPDDEMHQMGWSEGMLRRSADHMTMLSEHFYAGRTPWTEEVRLPLLEHVKLIKEQIRIKADGHREMQARLPHLNGRTVPIAMDEWNYWHRDYVYGELGCIYDLSDALGIAMGLHEFYRQTDIIKMAHYAQTVNVIGAIKTSRIAAEMESTGLILQLYRNHFGTLPLQLADHFGDLDIAAALTADGTVLTVGAVNPTDSPITLDLNSDQDLPDSATRWHVGGHDQHDHNVPGHSRVLDIQMTPKMSIHSGLEVPALSSAIFRFDLR
ncbi:MAG: alpha-L-arabinofuranosidase C-terminal domain-containing protein, partial [Opitutaceae bacterium]